MKIYWYLLKLSSGNEKRTDGRTMDRRTDAQTDGLTDDQRETIIPRHYCVAGYKNNLLQITKKKKKKKKKKKNVNNN